MNIAFLGDIVVDSEIKVNSEVSSFLKDADIVIANLEGVILHQGKRPSSYKTYGSVVYNDYDSVMRLIETVGITHVNLYNNHMIDYGESQFEKTLEILTKAGINVLLEKTNLKIGDETIKLHNSGLAETFGIYDVSRKFGQNINDMLLNNEHEEKWAFCIIHTHFGIEQVSGLSDYEYRWFNRMTQNKPCIIVRHHAHCIQSPFQLNGVPCFPSIGDFAFNFKNKKISKGLAVLFDVASSNISCRVIDCKDYQLKIASEEVYFRGKSAVRLSEMELTQLRQRYINEYREDGPNSLKKAIKYFIGKEKARHVLSMSTKHFIQPFVLDELL